MSNSCHVQLESLAEPVTSKVTATEKDPSLPYIGLEHIPSSGSKLLGHDKAGVSVSTNIAFKPGDILFGKLRPRLQKCIQIDFHGYCSTDILVLRPNPRLCSLYVGKIFRSDNVFQEAIRTEEGTRMPRTSWTDIRRLPVFAPSINEQKKIAEILTTVDRQIEKTEALIAKYEAVKEGVMVDLFSRGIERNGQLRPFIEKCPNYYKDSRVGLIPHSWQVKEGRDLFTLDAGTPPMRLRSDQVGECLYLKVEDFNRPSNRDELVEAEYTFDQSENASILVFEPGVIVFPKRGAAIFINRVQRLGKKATVDPNLMVLKPDPEINADWLRFKLLFLGLGSISDNSGIPQINNKHMYPLLLDTPPYEEQQRIANLLNGLDSYLKQNEKHKYKLQAIKQGLMQGLLTGKVRVNLDEAEEAVANA